MGIIDDYLKSNDDIKPSVNNPTEGSSIIDLYLNDPTETVPVTTGKLKPPVSGFSKEQSDIINAQPEIQGSANPRKGIIEGIKNLPSSTGKAISEDFTSGLSTVGQGLKDIRANKPATGVGEVGLGLLGAVTSPISGVLKTTVEEPVTALTGNPKIGERASLVASAAIPIVPSAKTASKLSPKNSAFRTLIESIGEENIPSVVSQMKTNYRLTPADLSAKVKQDTQHLFTVDGPHINQLSKTVENRTSTAKDAVQDIYDTSAGPSVDLVKKIDDLAKASKDVGAKEINPALVNSKPVNISNTLTAIDSILKPGVLKIGDSVPLTSVKKELQSIQQSLSTSKEYNASDLHSFQSGLRRTAESLLRSADGGSKEVGRALMDVRNSLVSDIDKASGGKYKPALNKYRDEMHISDAFKEGYQGIFSSSKTMENTPSFMKKWFDSLSDAEKQAAREGARASIATEIGVAKNPALAGEALSRSDFNREKLKILFGEEEANTLITKLEHERKIADTNNKLIQGSQTAMRSASKAAFDMPTKSNGSGLVPPAILEGANILAGGLPGLGTGAYVASRTGIALKNAIQSKLKREHNARYVKLALPTNEPDRQALIRSLEAVAAQPPKQSLLRRGATALSQVVKP